MPRSATSVIGMRPAMPNPGSSVRSDAMRNSDRFEESSYVTISAPPPGVGGDERRAELARAVGRGLDEARTDRRHDVARGEQDRAGRGGQQLARHVVGAAQAGAVEYRAERVWPGTGGAPQAPDDVVVGEPRQAVVIALDCRKLRGGDGSGPIDGSGIDGSGIDGSGIDGSGIDGSGTAGRTRRQHQPKYPDRHDLDSHHASQ